MERKEPALISLLARLFIKPDPAREEPETRRAYGVLCGIVGICLNVLLFAGKFLAGTSPGPSPSRRTPSTTCRTPGPPS